MSGRVGEDVTTLTPHRPGRADFPHPVLRGRVSLTVSQTVIAIDHLTGREWDLSGLQAVLPVPLLRSSTPVEPTCPRPAGHVDAAHQAQTVARLAPHPPV